METQAQQREVSYPSNTHYFHSNNPQTRRYSAGGFVYKNEEGRFVMRVAYAILSERDVFSKQKAHLIVDGRLDKENKRDVNRANKFFEVLLNDEQAAHPNQTFTRFVKELVPASAFNTSIQSQIMSDVLGEIAASEGLNTESNDEEIKQFEEKFGHIRPSGILISLRPIEQPTSNTIVDVPMPSGTLESSVDMNTKTNPLAIMSAIPQAHTKD